MPSSCANLAVHAAQLARAQREFFLAWKGVQSGDRTQFAHARVARHELENAHRDIQRALYAAWTPNVFEDVERKGQYRLVRTLSGGSHDNLVAMQVLPNSDLLLVYIGREGNRIVRRSPTDENGERMRTLFPFDTRAATQTCSLMPDGNLLLYARYMVYVVNPDTPALPTFPLEGSLRTNTEPQAYYDGRIFAGDTEGYVRVWTPQGDGTYVCSRFRAAQERISHLRVFPDGSLLVLTRDVLSHWKQSDGEWCEIFRPQLPCPVHDVSVSIDGSVALCLSNGAIQILRQDFVGVLHRSRTISAAIVGQKFQDAQMLPDQRIAFLTDAWVFGFIEMDSSGSYNITKTTQLLQKIGDVRSQGRIILSREGTVFIRKGMDSDILVLEGESADK